ncbi:MAG: YicC family protein [Rhodobacteraceae bacterium]|nr:YicC family protein [Paracoccaceae bacterium]MCY4140108.1 YicC family protein [Paracoccaceae bacterium]
MTGFATMSGQSGALNWAWELRSVNGRGFDIRFRLPGQCETLETSLRHAISRVCSRGRVSVSLNIGHDHRDAGILFDRLELDAVLDATRMIADAARDRGISLTPDSPSGILASAIATRGSGERESDLSELTPILEREIVKVVESWDESRLSEGRLIGEVLDSQVGSIASLVEDAEKTVTGSQSGAADRLRDNVAKLLDAKGDLDEGRIALELALLAVRSDVSEEIDRMRAHVVSARQLLETGGVIGRRFDFLAQELNREANTLCSKASSSGLNAVGLELKVVVDQLREQVQNVE